METIKENNHTNLITEILDEIIEGIVYDNFKLNSKIEDYMTSTKIKEKYSMNIIKSKIQHGGALCGFHCLFNAVNFLKFIKSEKNNLNHIQVMNSTPKFWSFYLKILKYLLSNENVDRSDKKSLQESDPLERYQFKLILSNHPEIKEIVSNDDKNEIEFFPFFFAFNFIQMTREEIINLQEALEKFRNYKEDKNLVYVILLGITNHWSLLLLENKKGEIQFNYIDSSNLNKVFLVKTKDEVSEYISFLCSHVTNINDLTIDAAEIKNFAENVLNEISKFRKPPQGWLKTCFYQWVSDINIAIKTLFKIVYEDYSLYSVYLESVMIRITDTFEEYNKCVLDIDEIENIQFNQEVVGKLLNWLNNEYHPKVLTSDLVLSIVMFNCQKIIKNFKIYPKLVNLLYYSKKVKTYTDDCNIINVDDKYLIQRFYEVINKLEELIL